MQGVLEVTTGDEKVNFMGTFEYGFVHGIIQDVKKDYKTCNGCYYLDGRIKLSLSGGFLKSDLEINFKPI